MTSQTTRVPELLGVIVPGLLISAVVCALRFYVRARLVRKIGVDDWVVLLSFVLLIVAFGLFATATQYGLGQHFNPLELDNGIYAIKLVWMAFQFTPTAEATGKISVAIMLMRVTTSKKWKTFFMALSVWNIAIGIGIMFSILMTCWPIQMLWDPRVPGHCNFVQRNVISYIQGATAAVSDLVLAVAPIFLLWDVKISKKSKWLLCGLLALGLFTAIAGFLRMYYTFDTYDAETQQDPTWGLMDFLIWKCVELSLSIIVGCLPTLRPLFDSNHWTKKSSRGYTDDSYALNKSGSRPQETIQKTTEIQVQSREFGSRTGSSEGDDAWEPREHV